MPKSSVYLETSVISYLTSWLSGELITAGRQKLTRTWWEQQRHRFDLCVSAIVITEVSVGDPEAARERRTVLAGLKVLTADQRTDVLAKQLIDSGLLPPKAIVDASHVATATIHAVDYLLTWNCKHIANAETREHVANLIRAQGYKAPILCTPEELMGRDV